MRVSRSRPMLSVPNQCAALEDSHRPPTISPSPKGAISGANTATNTKVSVRMMPSQALRGMRVNCMVAPSFRMPQAWIGQDRNHVGNDVEADIDGSEDQPAGLHRRNVALRH